MTPTEARKIAAALTNLHQTGIAYGASDALFALADQVEALQKDAERYRWIRTAGAWESEIGMDILSEDPTQFDVAVDSRMQET